MKQTTRQFIASKVSELVRLLERDVEMAQQRLAHAKRIAAKIDAGIEMGAIPVPHQDYSTRSERLSAQVDALITLEFDRTTGQIDDSPA